jgi:hypothetical protein
MLKTGMKKAITTIMLLLGESCDNAYWSSGRIGCGGGGGGTGRATP